MTNNTINNVPRELLERVLNAGWGSETVNALDDLRDFLESAPSPAGVDGLEVVAEVVWYDPELHGQTGDGCKIVDYSPSDLEHIPVGGKLYALPIDAQAIIDGLRGEVAEKDNALTLMIDTAARYFAQRDQLAGLLREIGDWVNDLPIPTRGATAKALKIDAALAELKH